ncbi:MAG: ABC transporter permease [archaeon]
MSFIARLVKKKEEPEEKVDVFIERPRLNSITKLYFIILKNFRILLRSKLSAFLFILGPLIIVFLIALAFNTSTLYDLNIAAYSESYSSISETIVTNLSDSQYNVIKMESEAECIDSIKFDNFQVCVVFPSNMILDNSANNIIKIYVDNSRLNIANLISSQINSKVSVSAEELSTDMVTTILVVLDNVNTNVVQSQATTTNLKNINAQLTSELSSAESSISGVDLSYTAYDSTGIETEISSIESSNNMSSSVFTDLKAQVNALRSAYNALTTTVDTATTGITSSSSTLGTAKATAGNELTKINTVETSLNTMNAEINTIKITNVENIVTPVKTTIEPISSTNNYLLYIIPSILIMIFMFVALLISSSNIMAEKTSLAYFRNFITPTNDLVFVIGEYISTAMVILLQIVIMLGIVYFFVPDPGVTAYLLAGLVLFIVASLFIFTGMLLAYMFNTKQTVTLASVSVGIVFLFFSNTILPLETLSAVTRKIVMYNPFVMAESILKKLLLFNAPFAEISILIYTLLGFTFALFIGAIATRLIFKRFFSS